MKKGLISLLLVFSVVMSLFALAENEPSVDSQSGYCAGFWGSLKCYLFGDAENRAGRSWFDRGNVVGKAVGGSRLPQRGEGFGMGDGSFVLFDGTHWQSYDSKGRILPASLFDETMNEFLNNLRPLPSGMTRLPLSGASPAAWSNYFDAGVYAPLSPTDPYEYRLSNGKWETRRQSSSDDWVSIDDSSLSPERKAEANQRLDAAYPDARQSSATATSSVSSTGSSAAPTPPPPSPEELARIAARENALFEARQAAESSKCFLDSTCAGPKLTHREASEKIRQIEYTHHFTTRMPLLSELDSAAAGSRLEINGVRYTKRASDNQWVNSRGEVATRDQLVTANDLISKENIPAVQQLRSQANNQLWQGSWAEALGSDAYLALAQGKWVGGEVIGTTFGAIKQLGQYQALSNALFGAEASRNWLINADNELLNRWSDLPAFASRELCNYDDARRSKSPGQSTTFVHTVGGSYQFVGSIQAEKSLQKSPILCQRTTDPDAESEWVCSTRQVCATDNFCYPDTNEDGTPDSPDPVSGYFYKITWGVTAPTDEKFTPYIDENGKAIKFNLQLTGDTSVWIYQRQGTDPRSVIALNNGQNDQDVIVHYSPHQFTQACIRYDDRSRAKDSDGNLVGDQCVSIIKSEQGKVEYGQSDRKTPSITTSSPEISRSSEW